MDEIPESLKQEWETDFIFLLEREHEDAIYRLLKSNTTGKYQLNRYFNLGNKWQVSIDLIDRDAEFVIEYFWNLWLDKQTTELAKCMG